MWEDIHEPVCLCMCKCMHAYQVSTPVSLYTYLTYFNKITWLPYCKYKSHSHYAKWA